MKPQRRVLTAFATLLLAGPLLTAGHRPRHRVPSHRPAKVHASPAPVARVPGAILNAQALAPFAAALGVLGGGEPQGSVRILQFGDSHTAADFWSGRVRQRLQARFGDGGPGCILPGRPWRGYPHAGVRVLNGVAWEAQSLRGDVCDGFVGLPGSSLTPTPGEPFTVQAPFDTFRVQLLGPGLEGLDVQSGPEGTAPARILPGLPEPLGEGRILQTFEGASSGRLSFVPPPGCRLLGVDLLSARPGVVYDELGLNGAELTDLERWDPRVRRALLRQAHPDLLVLAYGTNDMGKAGQDRPEYETRIRALLRTLKDEAGAPILVVGPLDRLGRKARQRPVLKAGAQWVIQALKQACLQTDCAFWDARQAMGGYGSLLRWRKQGLAQKDLIHLNAPGYQRLGDLLAEAMLGLVRR